VKEFYLYRRNDESGISGTGRVAQGVVFDDGRVVVVWLSDTSSINIYNSLGDVKSIHGHEGKTEVRMEPDYRRAYNELAALVNDTTLADVAGDRLPQDAEARKLLLPDKDKGG
jgi:hypothetical protein